MKELGLQMGPMLLLWARVSPSIGLLLQNVLHVPKISYNLLSSSKITKDLHCQAIFSPDIVSFQNLGTVGNYFLDDNASSRDCYRTSLLSSYFSTFEKDYMLWHFSLSHPKFPHLFSKVDISSLFCDVCISAKQHKVSFPFRPYKPTQPFTLIHNDV